MYLLYFGLITISVTITLLVITVCYIKTLSVQDIKLKKTTVKFGFYLLLGNEINLLGQIAPPIITFSWFAILDTHSADLIYTSYTFLNAALILTPILVLIYFKPIRKRLWQSHSEEQQHGSPQNPGGYNKALSDSNIKVHSLTIHESVTIHHATCISSNCFGMNVYIYAILYLTW